MGFFTRLNALGFSATIEGLSPLQLSNDDEYQVAVGNPDDLVSSVVTSCVNTAIGKYLNGLKYEYSQFSAYCLNWLANHLPLYSSSIKAKASGLYIVYWVIL